VGNYWFDFETQRSARAGSLGKSHMTAALPPSGIIDELQANLPQQPDMFL
jgi:hypothetical protein